jgi:hypothetical protein
MNHHPIWRGRLAGSFLFDILGSDKHSGGKCHSISRRGRERDNIQSNLRILPNAATVGETEATWNQYSAGQSWQAAGADGPRTAAPPSWEVSALRAMDYRSLRSTRPESRSFSPGWTILRLIMDSLSWIISTTATDWIFLRRNFHNFESSQIDRNYERNSRDSEHQ